MSQAEITANSTGENFAELLDQSFQEMASIEGSVVSGTVLSIEKDMILIDFIPRYSFIGHPILHKWLN